jgi:hypothetical protein
MLKAVCILLALGVAEIFAGCHQHHLDQYKESVTCESLGSPVAVGGNLYGYPAQFYNPLSSVYYMATIAKALGYNNPQCTDKTFLKGLRLLTPWNGLGAVAIDQASGAVSSSTLVLRNCVFPNPPYPFLCTFARGTQGTNSPPVGDLSYISLLQDPNNRWTLFGICYNPKTLQHPNRTPTAVTFQVFSLDPELSVDDKASIVGTLAAKGFNTDETNFIQPNYTSLGVPPPPPTPCAP